MEKTKRVVKKSVNGFGIFVEVFLGIICAYFVIALYGMIFPCGNHNHQQEVTLFVRSNGVHTDLCIPSKTVDRNWWNKIPLAHYADTSKSEYIGIGWGDKGFFLDTPTWAELKFSTAFNALFLPSPTALHVEYMNRPEESETCKKVHISRKEYQDLIRFIDRSFRKEKGKVDLIPGHGYGLTDNFYEANGSYHMFNTCNVWTNDALKTCNIRTSLFSVLPEGNMVHL